MNVSSYLNESHQRDELMDCPKCKGKLEPQNLETATAYRCTDCAGLWLNFEDLQALQDIWMSEAILDTGDPRIGQKLNKVTTGMCPLGHGLMEHVQDEDQVHIGYEVCADCHGVFLDAGEFTDLKHSTPLDTIRDLIVRLKQLRG